jgi:hypothetical protein
VGYEQVYHKDSIGVSKRNRERKRKVLLVVKVRAEARIATWEWLAGEEAIG